MLEKLEDNLRIEYVLCSSIYVSSNRTNSLKLSIFYVLDINLKYIYIIPKNFNRKEGFHYVFYPVFDSIYSDATKCFIFQKCKTSIDSALVFILL